MAINKLSDIVKADVKTYFGIPSTDVSKDGKIDLVIPLTNSMIMDFCRHDFESKARVSERPIVEENSLELYVKYRPVVSVASLTEDGVALIENSDFYVDKDFGRIRKLKDSSSIFNSGYFGYWNSGPGKIVISYTGGEALSPDVQLVAFELIGIWAGLKVKTYATNEGVEGAVNLTDIPDSLKEVLLRHQHIRV